MVRSSVLLVCFSCFFCSPVAETDIRLLVYVSTMEKYSGRVRVKKFVVWNKF